MSELLASFFAKKKTRTSLENFRKNAEENDHHCEYAMEPTPHFVQYSWLKEQEKRIDLDEAAIVRFGTVYVRYGVLPHKPPLDKPGTQTYLTYARQLIPRRRLGGA